MYTIVLYNKIKSIKLKSFVFLIYSAVVDVGTSSELKTNVGTRAFDSSL